MQNLLAEEPVDRKVLFEQLKENRVDDLDNWHERSFLYLYHCGEDVLQVTKDAYQLYFMADRMAPSAFPSIAKYEREIVETVLSINGAGEKAGGSVTTGGTESIFFGMKTARDWARDRHAHIKEPEAVISVHCPPGVQQDRAVSGHESNPYSRAEGGFPRRRVGNGRRRQREHHHAGRFGAPFPSRGHRSDP